MSLLIDFCIDYRTYLCWQVSSILFSIIISSFDFNSLQRSLISKSKKKLYITSHHVSGFCLTPLYSISLGLICTSVSKMFQSIFKLLDRTCMFTCLPFVKNFSLWSNCMKYKRKILWTTTKLNKAIWISYLIMYMYFKISLQIKLKSRVSKRTSDYLLLHSQNFNVCMQNKTITIQWNQNITRT